MLKRTTWHAVALAVAGASCAGQSGTEPAEGQPQTVAGAAAPVVPVSATTPTSAGAQPTAAAAVGGGATPPAAVTPAGATPSGAAPGVAIAQMPGAAPLPGETAAANVPPAGDLPKATGKPISESCRGFDFTGLVYSPGGEVLPNKCEAFHPTLNNPYAVRCIDAWPWYKTEFAGDQYCVLPPTPEKGIQFGHHPQGEYDAWFKAVSQGDMSGYDKSKLAAGWMLEPGAEEERNINIRHMNKGGKYSRTSARMRGGSHHMIASAIATAPAQTFVWGPGSPDGLFGGTGVPGAQRPDENSPQSARIPVEDDGLYREVAANATITYNMHHFNPTDKVILKEAWQNIWWSDNPQTPINSVNGLPLQQAVGIFANPGEIVDMHYGYAAPGQLRILGVFGHRHAWTTNFSAWVKRGGKDEIIYQSFDWFDEPTYQYNSEVKNPVSNASARIDGAASGVLTLQAGDELHFNCHIEYTDARAMEENSPITPTQNGPLRFANEAFTAEMCILFGGAVGQTGDMVDMGPPPDFAKAR